MGKVLIAAAIAGVVVVSLLILSESEPRRTGTNNVVAGGEAVRLAPGERECQLEKIPPGTEAIAVPMLAAPARGSSPSLVVTAQSDRGRRTASGVTTSVAPDGRVLAPLGRRPGQGAAEVCFRNRGDGRMTLLGLSDTVAVDYYAGRQTWWRAAPSVASRFGLGKSDLVGPWTFWLALALVASAWLVAWRALADSGSRT